MKCPFSRGGQEGVWLFISAQSRGFTTMLFRTLTFPAVVESRKGLNELIMPGFLHPAVCGLLGGVSCLASWITELGLCPGTKSTRICLRHYTPGWRAWFFVFERSLNIHHHTVVFSSWVGWRNPIPSKLASAWRRPNIKDIKFRFLILLRRTPVSSMDRFWFLVRNKHYDALCPSLPGCSTGTRSKK